MFKPFETVEELADWLKLAQEAHHAFEQQLGHPDPDWPGWYAKYIASRHGIFDAAGIHPGPMNLIPSGMDTIFAEQEKRKMAREAAYKRVGEMIGEYAGPIPLSLEEADYNYKVARAKQLYDL